MFDYKLYKHPTYHALCSDAADTLITMLKDIQEPLICPASGDSPKGLYAELVRRNGSQILYGLNTSQWNFVGLDEWHGLNGKDEGSCRYHLDRDFFMPMNIDETRICFFDGRVENAELECERVAGYIRANGGIDVAIVGVGMNGHVGMNEPGVDPNLYTHVTQLDAVTQKVGQKYFSKPTNLVSGLTLGFAALMEAKNVMLIASGAHKAPVIKKFLESEPTRQFPVSLLKLHPSLHVFVDEAAMG